MKRIKSKHTYISIYRFIQTAIMNCISTLPHATASRAHAVKITKLRLEKSQAKKKKKLWTALSRANRESQFFECHLHTEIRIKL